MKGILQQCESEDGTTVGFYEFTDGMKAHPVKESDKKWTKESIKTACELFFEYEELIVDDCSEPDLLHSVWEFTYNLYQQKGIKTKLGERISKAVSSTKNADRAIKAIDRNQEKPWL